MNRIILSTLLSAAFSLGAVASEKPATGSEKPAMGSEKPAIGSEKQALGSEKPVADHAHEKMTKADRTQKHLEDVKKMFEDHKTKAATITGTIKKMVDYYMARADLAIKAAEDVDMKDHMMIHIREAKHDLKKAERQITGAGSKKEAAKK